MESDSLHGGLEMVRTQRGVCGEQNLGPEGCFPATTGAGESIRLGSVTCQRFNSPGA
jgi:hypothetical protein